MIVNSYHKYQRSTNSEDDDQNEHLDLMSENKRLVNNNSLAFVYNMLHSNATLNGLNGIVPTQSQQGSLFNTFLSSFQQNSQFNKSAEVSSQASFKNAQTNIVSQAIESI